MKSWWLIVLAACGGTTGGANVSFVALASGPADAAPALTFTTLAGYHVELDQAQLHMGALYFNEGEPIAGTQETGCILHSTYIAEVRGGCDVDLLSPQAVPFTAPGTGLARLAATGEIWFTDGDINAAEDTTPIVTVSGTATRSGVSYPFSGVVTIGQNRVLPPLSPATPGSNPLCKQRIVSGLRAEFTPANHGTMQVRVDPRPWFATLDFAQLPHASPTTYQIADALNDEQSAIFFTAFKARSGYLFEWTP